jgi:tubulin polyglutamylase TTLL6/13
MSKKDFNFKVTKGDSDEKWDIYWSDTFIYTNSIRSLELHQKINHFHGMYNLHRKSNLALNLNKMRKQFPKFYDFYPVTYLLPTQRNELFAEFGVDVVKRETMNLRNSRAR